jgi:polyisoprenoid-binding protein YceI
MKNRVLAATAAAVLLAASVQAETYTIDRGHSSATFSVRHLMTKARGRFTDFAGTLELDKAHPEASKVDIVIQAKSISTDNEHRDEDLRGDGFFDVAKFPTITFKSTKIVPAGKDKYDVTGDFTMHGVTKSITVPVQFLGFMPGKTEKAGFEIATTLNRKDYAIVWNRALDAGGTLLGDDVDIVIDVEAQAAAPAAPASPAAK